MKGKWKNKLINNNTLSGFTTSTAEAGKYVFMRSPSNAELHIRLQDRFTLNSVLKQYSQANFTNLDCYNLPLNFWMLCILYFTLEYREGSLCGQFEEQKQ